MSPSHGRIQYEIDDRGLINVLHGRAAVLHTLRDHLTGLDQYSHQQQHVGSQLLATFGRSYEPLKRAKSRRAAAQLLHQEVLNDVKSLTISRRSEPAHAQLRDALATTMTGAAAPVADPFKTMYQRIADKSRDWYGEHWPSGVNIALRALGKEKNPYHQGCRFWLAARTARPADSAVAPTIILSITPEFLNLETYAATFAVLVHEFVCHVPAAHAESSNASPFAEGLSDWAARQLFERWLDGFDPPLFSEAARRFGRRIWDLGISHGEGNAYWAERCIGHDAAANISYFFRQAGHAAAIATDLTIFLSRELTVLDASLMSKDNFVRRIAASREEVIGHRLIRWCDEKTEGSIRAVLPPY